MTQTYYGTKRVTAWREDKEPRMVFEDDDVGYVPVPNPGYAVKYEDGYISWSPKDVFEKAYKASGQMGFGHALTAMHDGHKVRMPWWPADQHMYIEDGALRVSMDDGSVDALFAISNSDLLATGWMIVD